MRSNYFLLFQVLDPELKFLFVLFGIILCVTKFTNPTSAIDMLDPWPCQQRKKKRKSLRIQQSPTSSSFLISHHSHHVPLFPSAPHTQSQIPFKFSVYFQESDLKYYCLNFSAMPCQNLQSSLRGWILSPLRHSSNLIDLEGIEASCLDVEVDHTDVTILMLAWKMN